MQTGRRLLSPDVAEGGAVSAGRPEMSLGHLEEPGAEDGPSSERIATDEEARLRLRAIETAHAEQSQRTAALERAYRGAVLERDLANELAGRPLVPGAAAQLVKLWRDDFDVIDDGTGARVVSRDGRPVGQVVAERLASPEYAHFCPSGPRGGTAARGPGPVVGATGPSLPKNLGEAAIRRWLEGATRMGDGSAPVGLHRRRR